MQQQRPQLPGPGAPGIIKPPVKRDNTATTMAVVGIVLLLLVGSLCSSVIPAPRADQLNGTVIAVMAVISFPIWGGLIILFVKLNIANKKKMAHEVLEESQAYVQAGEHYRQQAAARQLAVGSSAATRRSQRQHRPHAYTTPATDRDHWQAPGTAATTTPARSSLISYT